MSQHNKFPIRCFEGSANPYEPFWKFRDAAEPGGSTELELYGPISEYSWLGDEITPKKFKDDLNKFGSGGPVLLKINSPGGDPIAASVMRTIMMEYSGEITTRIDGMAASAAVAVALAGKSIKIMDTAYMMIHDPAVVVMMAALNIETLGALRDDLKSIKQGLVDTYAARTGLNADRVSRMMTAETWMSAQEAVSYGFADEVISGGQKPANQFSNMAFVNALQNYVNVPQALLPRDAEAESMPESRDQAEAKPDPRKVEALRNYLKVHAQSKIKEN